MSPGGRDSCGDGAAPDIASFLDGRDARQSTTRRAEDVLERIRAIPEGFVRAYGDVSPGAPRYAGTVLSACEDPAVPWWRVVRADGSLAKGERQRALLEAEGVPFRGDRVEMRTARMIAPA